MTKVVKPTGKVHPVAELFPMLPPDELNELAEDIRQYGLRDPIVLDEKGMLVDGRNRLEACKLADVEPTFTTLNGEEPLAFILSKNTKRRNLNKGQSSLAAVKAVELTVENFSTLQTREIARLAGVEQENVAGHCRTVMTYAPELVDSVIAGGTKFADAYEAAKKRKQFEVSAEKRLVILQEEDAELARAVAEEILTLDEAWRNYHDRLAKAKRAREDTTNGFSDGLSTLWSVVSVEGTNIAELWEPKAHKLRSVPVMEHLWTAAGMRDIAARLIQQADYVDAIGGELPRE